MALINRKELRTYLQDVGYPATKQQLLDLAEQNGADAEVMHILDSLPDSDYESSRDVSQQVGKI